VDGTDIEAVYKVMQEAVERARSGEGATVIEAMAYRLTPHSSDDDDRSYRTREEVEAHKKTDPIPLTQRLLLSRKIVTQEHLDEMEARAKTEIDQAVMDATTAPYPAPEEALHPVYAEEVTHA
jgi:2-oxoisovalerate dehydrogenase E1 component alpha subunit